MVNAPRANRRTRHDPMDVKSANAAYSPASLGGRGGVGAAPGYAARLAQFDSLSATVLDAGGGVNDAQRTQAYQALQSMSGGGQLIGLDDSRRKILDQATYDSDIGKRAQALGRSFVQTLNAASQSGGPQAALQAVASSYDNLSAADQDLLFQTTINMPDRTGARPYPDAASWRANVDAQAKVVGFMRDAGVVAANGVLDQKAAQARAAEDPKVAEALRLSLRRDNNSAEWTQSVMQLLGGSAPRDTVQLSEAAQTFLASAPQQAGATAPAPSAYRQGSIASITA